MKRILGLDFLCFMSLILFFFPPHHVNVYCRKSKKITIMKNCAIHRSLVFDCLALGNYILNNRAKWTTETQKKVWNLFNGNNRYLVTFCCSSVYIVNFEHIAHIVLEFHCSNIHYLDTTSVTPLPLTLNKFHTSL